MVSRAASSGCAIASAYGCMRCMPKRCRFEVAREGGRVRSYDYIVVGSGFFGSVFAQQAHEAGKSVLVLEKRDHIGGNCYSYDYEDTGITVHKYGTHIFHTSDVRIWKYI